MKKILTFRVTLLLLIFYIQSPHAVTRGLLNSDNISDDAIVCMNIGIFAELTGLDDIELITNDINGSAGAVFEGSDQFYLNSNAAVSVKISAPPLKNGTHEIFTEYKIDDVHDQLDTLTGVSHADIHSLNIKAMLGNISDQKAGAYSSIATLTVVPLYGASGGCGQKTFNYPQRTTWATMAFEDLYPRPGDADYNDMVVNFRIQENYNASQELENVQLQFIPIARGAGYNHSLHLDLDGVIQDSQNINYISDPSFNGGAEIKVTYSNLLSGEDTIKYFNETDDITLLSNTRASIGGFANVNTSGQVSQPNTMTTVSISLNDPSLNPYREMNDGRNFSFRPYLHVNNTNKDIDLYQVNPYDGMIDSNGYPFGLLVPSDWSWPTERTDIDKVYPYFEEYRNWLSGEVDDLSPQAEYWYNYVSPSNEHLVFDRTLFNEEDWVSLQ